MKPRHVLFVLAVLVWLTGCSTPSHIVFQQAAVVGADVAADTTSGQAHVSLGYDRQTNAMIPKTKTYVTQRNLENGVRVEQEENEAMSALSASRVRIKWFGAHEVNEQFATGEAAVNIAADPDAVATLSTLSEAEEKKP